MTADAKVGLLLGLIFIVVIAFLINGLPGFLKSAQADEPFDTQIAISPSEELVIDNRVVTTAQEMSNDIPLRKTTPPQQVVVLGDGAAAERIEPVPSVAVHVPNAAPNPQPAVQQTTPAPRYHVVQPGEILPVIARKYYGQEEGNRRAVVQKLYEANKRVLESPDKIRVDDKLIIPPLEELLNGPRQTVTVASNQDKSNSLLNRFSNFFEPAASDKGDRYYVVQQGESLWSIAQKTLGDGKRYKEIMAINSSIKDSDDVKAGMNLKIPQK